MAERTVSIKTSATARSYDINIKSNSLADCGGWAAYCLDREPGKVVIVSNKHIFGLYGGLAVESLSRAGFVPEVHLIGNGERFKSFRTLEATISAFSRFRLSRTDAVMALGGGVVGDLTGFAASIYLRGVKYLQVPTTFLSMIDSSVGGKTAINTPYGKNLTGSFYQPAGVLIDPAVLRTLPRRELTAGFCEAVKQGAIAGPELFAMTAEMLNSPQRRRLNEGLGEMEDLLAAQVAFKAAIVAGDELEDPERTDSLSRKILNFGHTFGHALEKATGYRYLKHGEAVGYGILFAAEISRGLEILSADEVELLNGVVHLAGKLPPIAGIDPELLFDTFQFDKKVVNNSLQWVLLKGLGKPVIVQNSDIPRSLIRSAIRQMTHN